MKCLARLWDTLLKKLGLREEIQVKTRVSRGFDDDDPLAWMDETPMRDFHDDCGDR